MELEQIRDQILANWQESELCKKYTFKKIINDQIHFNLNESFFASAAIYRIRKIITKYNLTWHISNYNSDDNLLIFVIYK